MPAESAPGRRTVNPLLAGLRRVVAGAALVVMVAVPVRCAAPSVAAEGLARVDPAEAVWTVSFAGALPAKTLTVLLASKATQL